MSDDQSRSPEILIEDVFADVMSEFMESGNYIPARTGLSSSGRPVSVLPVVILYRKVLYVSPNSDILDGKLKHSVEKLNHGNNAY